MSEIKEAELLFAKLEKLSKQANMSVREYILENGTVEEGSADSRTDWGGGLFTMQDMSFMIFYIQPSWENQIAMMLKSYGDEGLEKIDYALWRKNTRIVHEGGTVIGTASNYVMELETTTGDDRWGANHDWIYLNLDDVLANSYFLNWKDNPLEVK
tara:strand:- start:92 stop:559 length:468 start_codon:yes stop_codon:yes gene_type:complete